ncbi:MAG: sphingomyelin phosphodiesterase [Paludibacter sp.]|nr:sphingomyelin phosphodiesterase [Paludibacter sp.]
MIQPTTIHPTSKDKQLNERQVIDAETLKILSWNIYMLPYISLFNHNDERAEAIAEKLQYSDCHIIVFQEAFSSKCRNILAKRLTKAYPYQYGPANKCYTPFRTSSGLWVVSKIPLTLTDKIEFSISKGFDVIARKGAVLFGGEFRGAKFQLLTTHLQADSLHQVREQQCNEIKDHLLNQYFDPDIPQIICGDFNIEMDDHVNYRLMLHTLEARNGEITGDVKFTYDEIENTLVRKESGKKKVIDYILIRNDQWINRIERKVQTFYAMVGREHSNLSDHYAMQADIDFNTSLLIKNTLISAVR